MLSAVLLASSLLAAVLVVALVREVRLRRALQRLLSRLLAVWRNRHAEDHRVPSADVGNSVSDPGDRL